MDGSSRADEHQVGTGGLKCVDERKSATEASHHDGDRLVADLVSLQPLEIEAVGLEGAEGPLKMIAGEEGCRSRPGIGRWVLESPIFPISTTSFWTAMCEALRAWRMRRLSVVVSSCLPQVADSNLILPMPTPNPRVVYHFDFLGRYFVPGLGPGL